MFGIAVGLVGLYYMLSKRLVYCPMGDTDAVFATTADTRPIFSEVSGVKFRYPVNFTAFEKNQKDGKHDWLIFQGLLPDLKPLSKKLGMLDRSKLDDCDFYIRGKIVTAVVQKKPKPFWTDRGGADIQSAARMLKRAEELSGPYGLKEHRNMKLEEGYDNYPFQQVWLYSHTFPDRRVIFYCWRDKIGSKGCYTKAEPFEVIAGKKTPNVFFKYFFHRDDLKHWKRIDAEVRLLLKSVYKPSQ